MKVPLITLLVVPAACKDFLRSKAQNDMLCGTIPSSCNWKDATTCIFQGFVKVGQKCVQTCAYGRYDPGNPSYDAEALKGIYIYI